MRKTNAMYIQINSTQVIFESFKSDTSSLRAIDFFKEDFSRINLWVVKISRNGYIVSVKEWFFALSRRCKNQALKKELLSFGEKTQPEELIDVDEKLCGGFDIMQNIID